MRPADPHLPRRGEMVREPAQVETKPVRQEEDAPSTAQVNAMRLRARPFARTFSRARGKGSPSMPTEASPSVYFFFRADVFRPEAALFAAEDFFLRIGDLRLFAAALPPFRPPFSEGDVFISFPRPEPLFLPPPVSLFTVAQARPSASFFGVPRSS